MFLANLLGLFYIKNSVMVTELMVLLAVPDVKVLDGLGSHSPVPHLDPLCRNRAVLQQAASEFIGNTEVEEVAL